jgi:hypothetical protein
MGFSQRMGLKPMSKEIQIDSIDNELRNGLWNIFKLHLLDMLTNQRNALRKNSEFLAFCINIWDKHYKLKIDDIPYDNYDCTVFIREKFFNYDWHEVYDFIEFTFDINFEIFDKEYYKETINELLIREFSGYRIIDDRFCPITNEIEIIEIRGALNHYTASEGSNIHLSNAVSKLSDKKNPDYANSIKESISALGSVIRKLTGESTFGKGLGKLSQNGIIINDQIRGSIDKIYAYTNNKEEGIRHEIVDEHKGSDFNDAKLMLVVCSSYINYLISKSVIKK